VENCPGRKERNTKYEEETGGVIMRVIERERKREVRKCAERDQLREKGRGARNRR
jgi:hypothetical protein